MKRVGTFILNHASAGSWGAEWVDRNYAILLKESNYFILKEDGLVPFTFPKDTDYHDPCGNPRDRRSTHLNDGETAIESFIIVNGRKTIYRLSDSGEILKINEVMEQSDDKKIIVKHVTDNHSSIIDEYYRVPSSCYCIHIDGYISSNGKRNKDYRNDNSAKSWISQYLPNCPFL